MHTLWNRFISLVQHSALEQWLINSDILRTTPLLPWRFMWEYAGLIIFCWIAAIALIFVPLHVALRDRIGVFLWTNAFIGSILFFFRYQYLPIVGMDIWRLIQEISAGIWILVLFYYYRTSHQALLRKEEAVAYKQKYLPKAKK